MGKWWKLGALLLMVATLPSPARAQFLFFGRRPAEEQPPAFSNGPGPQAPEFAPDRVPPGTPDFAPPPGAGAARTPFVPVEEENRNAFQDYKTPEDPPLTLWFKGEYLNFQFKNPNLAAVLATSSTAPDLNTDFGALGQPNTKVILGSGPFTYGTIPGARVTAGMALSSFIPFEVSGFTVQKNLTLMNAFSAGGPTDALLARPVNGSQFPGPLNNGQEVAFLAGFPNEASGTLSVSSTTNLWGVEASFFFNIGSTDMLFIDLFAGYRYLQLRESITITNSLSPLDPLLVVPFNADPLGFGPGFTTGSFDQFSTQNQFNGFQFGARTGLSFGRVGLLFDTKLAMGATSQLLDIAGTSTILTPASPFRGPGAVVPGGVLAVPSNSGRFSADDFSIVPEVDINLGFQLHRSVRLFGGFSIFYWNSVIRPGDQLNSIIDTRQTPTSFAFVANSGATTPHTPFTKSDFFAFGFNAGIMIGF